MYLFCFDTSSLQFLLSSFFFFYPSSISQITGAESQAKTERMEQIQAELENMRQKSATLGQQIDQYEHACSRAKEEQGKMRWGNKTGH